MNFNKHTENTEAGHGGHQPSRVRIVISPHRNCWSLKVTEKPLSVRPSGIVSATVPVSKSRAWVSIARLVTTESAACDPAADSSTTIAASTIRLRHGIVLAFASEQRYLFIYFSCKSKDKVTHSACFGLSDTHVLLIIPLQYCHTMKKPDCSMWLSRSHRRQSGLPEPQDP